MAVPYTPYFCVFFFFSVRSLHVREKKAKWHVESDSEKVLFAVQTGGTLHARVLQFLLDFVIVSVFIIKLVSRRLHGGEGQWKAILAHKRQGLR